LWVKRVGSWSLLVVHGVLFDWLQHWWIGLNDRLNESHHVLQVWLVAHVPACQISNGDFIHASKVILCFDDACIELLVNVHLWRSEWKVYDENDLDLELQVGSIACFKETFEHEHVGGKLVSWKLHRLNSRFEIRESLQKSNAL